MVIYAASNIISVIFRHIVFLKDLHRRHRRKPNFELVRDIDENDACILFEQKSVDNEKGYWVTKNQTNRRNRQSKYFRASTNCLRRGPVLELPLVRQRMFLRLHGEYGPWMVFTYRKTVLISLNMLFFC